MILLRTKLSQQLLDGSSLSVLGHHLNPGVRIREDVKQILYVGLLLNSNMANPAGCTNIGKTHIPTYTEIHRHARYALDIPRDPFTKQVRQLGQLGHFGQLGQQQHRWGSKNKPERTKNKHKAGQ